MNVLIVGLGSIAHKHISVLRQIDDSITIYALRSSSTSKQVEGIIDIYSLDELQNRKIDFAIISNPTSEHKNTILNVLEYIQCPLFIEKPLYHTLEIDDVLDKVQQSGVLTYVACNLRFLGCLQYVKHDFETNKRKTNEVNSYCGSYLPDWREGDFRKNYSAMPSQGGGVHIDLIHELDYLYWLFGRPSNVKVTLKNKSSLCIESIDYANYCLDYDYFCSNVVLNYYRRDYKRTLEILFEDETWLIDIYSNRIKCGDTIIFSSDQTIGDTYFAQMQYFINLVEQGKEKSFNSIYDAHNVLKICLHDIEK